MLLPDQELFDYIFEKSEELGFNTYDHLPLRNENAPYPFVEIGDVQQVDLPTKTAIGAQLTITINIWGDGESRFNVSQMAEKLAQLANQSFVTDNFRFIGRPSQTDKQIVTDMSVEDTVLKHGILTLVFSLG